VLHAAMLKLEIANIVSNSPSQSQGLLCLKPNRLVSPPNPGLLFIFTSE
jgi:hypothetical protein